MQTRRRGVTVSKRGERFYMRCRVPERQPDGSLRSRQVSRSLNARTARAAKSEALRVHDGLMASAQDALEAQAAGRTLLEAADEWLGEQAGRAASTQRGYESLIDHWVEPWWEGTRLEEVDSSSISRWRSWLLRQPRRIGQGTLSESYVRQLVSRLGHLLGWCVRQGLLDASPLRQVKRIREPRQPDRVLTAAQLSDVLEQARKLSPDWWRLYLCLWCCGLRIGEARGLTWGQIDFDSGVLTVDRQWLYHEDRPGPTKTRRVNRLRPAGALLEELRPLRREPGDLVFPGQSPGRPFGLTSARKHWARACAAAGVPAIRLHDIRHSAASHLVLQGVSLRQVQAVLGHASYNQTERYAHLQASQLQQLDQLTPRTGQGRIREMRLAIPEEEARALEEQLQRADELGVPRAKGLQWLCCGGLPLLRERLDRVAEGAAESAPDHHPVQ